MKESAETLKTYLQEILGFKVFICTELKGGEMFRDEIVRAVKNCKYFIILMNEEWASSGECEDEYSLAKRLNLTSHERGITKRDAAREPIMVPIAFPNLSWDKHYHVELLAAVSNFIVHSSSSLSQGSNTTLETVVKSIDSGSSIKTGTEGDTTSSASFENQFDQLSALLSQAANMISPLKHKLQESGRFSSDSNSYELSKRFLGITKGFVKNSETTFSVELDVENIDENSGDCQGQVIYRVLSVKSDGSKTGKELLKKVKTEAHLQWEGNFNQDTGLLKAVETNVKSDDTGLLKTVFAKRSEYRLMLANQNSQLLGTLSGLENKWDIAFRAKAF